MRNGKCAIFIAQELVRIFAILDAMDRPELHDPRVLRAIAHPVRSRILTELDAHGAMRAADVASVLGIPANSASFHLRQLARFGLIEEDPSAARDRRDRVWRAADAGDRSIQLDQVEKMPGGKAASKVFRRTKAAWTHHLVDLAYGDDRTPGVQRTVAEQALRLTKDEAGELTNEIVDLVDAWRKRNQGHEDDGRTSYHVLHIVQPLPDQPGGG